MGSDHPLREPCRAIVRLARAGKLDGVASPDLIQEFVHLRARRTGDRVGACEMARDVALLCRFDDLTERDAIAALDLFVRHDRLTARDASFAAFALNRGVDAILSVDRDLDGIDGLTRVDPADVASVAALAG